MILKNQSRIITLLNLLPHLPDTNIPEGVQDADIVDFSQRTDIVIPQQVEAWLRITNGPFIDSQAMFGLRKPNSFQEIEYYYELYPIWKDLKWIPIGTDGTGNYYIVPTKNEYGRGFPVLFVDTAVDYNKPHYIVASDMAHFLEFLLEDELRIATQWPFDEEYMKAKDPDILRFEKVELPWSVM